MCTVLVLVNPWEPMKTAVGKEWFMTSIDFLDAVAGDLGLRIEFIGESDFAV